MVGSTSSDMARVAYRRDTNELAVDFSEETYRGRKEDIINNIHTIFQCLYLAARVSNSCQRQPFFFTLIDIVSLNATQQN